MHLAEVAPAGGAAVALEALPYLFALALLYFALGGIKAVVYFVDFVIWIIRKTVGHIPFAGGAIEGLAKRGAAKLTNALGHAEAGIDQYIGFCWHNLAHVVRWTLRVMEHLSHQLIVDALAARLHISRRQAARLITAFLHPIRTLQAIERKLLHALRSNVTVVTHTVGAHVLPRLGTAEAELEHVVEWDIPRLRARSRAIEHRLDRLWKWAHRRTTIALTGALVGAVAWALTKLGGRWIGCRNWRRIGKHVCGLPFNLIEDLLAISLGFELVIDPEEIAQVALDVESAFEGVFERIAG
jgi:hypothetical protein